MFQVASLILWSMDEYYYYAVCIFLISVFSIATTVLETKSVSCRLYLTLTMMLIFSDHAALARDITLRMRCSCIEKWIL